MARYSDIIGRWPSLSELAQDLGEEVGTVRQWRNRDTLPPRVWERLVEAARERAIADVTLEVLAAIATARAGAA